MKKKVFPTLVLFLLLLGCQAKIESESEVYSCSDGYVIYGYRDIRQDEFGLANASLEKIKKFDEDIYTNLKEKYCQKMKIFPREYCFSYLLKDYSPGGDYTFCHSKISGEIVSAKNSYGAEIYPSNK